MRFSNGRTDLRFMIVIGTFGNQGWQRKAYETAFPSAVIAMGGRDEQVIVSYGKTLADARNTPAFIYGTSLADWLVFLDADDELDPEYISAMQERIKNLPEGDFVIQPATVEIRDGVQVGTPGLIPPKKSLWHGNHCVIGSALPTRLFFEVGGFDEWPAWEDWGLWLKCMKAGAQFTTCPEAIYRVGVDTTTKSRNQIDQREAQRLYARMRRYYEQDRVTRRRA